MLIKTYGSKDDKEFFDNINGNMQQAKLQTIGVSCHMRQRNIL